MSNLSFVDVQKNYGDESVLRDINIDIHPGEFIIVVGPSGCGKSSLLRMVAGLESVSAGDIFIGKERVNDVEPKARDIAMVFQNYALYPHMSVYKNMAYGLKMRRMTDEDIRAQVSKVAKVLKIEALLNRKPHELSGGQRQRVAMGRAIVRQPEVFLFDEPLSNLDAKLRMEMRLEIKTLQRRLGVTSLYVTHDQTEAMTMADRIVVLNQGLIEQIDTPLTIYQQPHSMFVAGFMGSSPINFIPARISEAGRIAKCDCGIILPLEKPLRAGLDGVEVILGVRAEHITIAKDGDVGRFEFKVTMVEAMGADTLVYGNVFTARQSLTVRLNGHWSIQEGEVLPLTLKSSSISLFDKQTTLRVEGAP